MTRKLVLIALCLATSTASADDPWAAPAPADGGAAPAPTDPPPVAPPTTDGPPTDAPATEAPATEPAPVAPAPVAPAPPPVAPAPPPVAPAPPAVAPAPPAPEPAPAVRAKRVDDYYSRQRAFGIFHRGRLALGAHSGNAPVMMDGVATGATEGRTMAMLAFDGAYLGLPSSFGNFHGVEFSTGLRAAPFDFWLSFGTAVTFLNIGHGGPGSFRIGGSFGAGFNLAHGFGYVRGRAALVVIPMKLDAEVSVQWTPPSASTSNFDEQLRRISVWYRPGKSKFAWEVFVEQFRRIDATSDLEREFDGYGAGLAMTR